MSYVQRFRGRVPFCSYMSYVQPFTNNLYLKKYYFRRPSVYKFVELFKSTNKYNVKNLCKYVYEAFKFRLTNTVDVNV